MHELKNNNNGISLIEILVGLAITGIVTSMIATVMVSGSNWFTKQSSVVDAQNEAQIINNIVTTALLETAEQVKKSNSAVDGQAVQVIDTGGKKLVYAVNSNSLYVFDAADSITLEDGYLLSRYITEFNVNADNSLEHENILMVDVTYTISNGKTTLKQEISVSPRNSNISFITEP